MSKCREEFISRTGYTPEEYELAWYHWQAAWNARGKVDAEICRAQPVLTEGNHGYSALKVQAALIEAIEKENEK